MDSLVSMRAKIFNLNDEQGQVDCMVLPENSLETSAQEETIICTEFGWIWMETHSNMINNRQDYHINAGINEIANIRC